MSLRSLNHWQIMMQMPDCARRGAEALNPSSRHREEQECRHHWVDCRKAEDVSEARTRKDVNLRKRMLRVLSILDWSPMHLRTTAHRCQRDCCSQDSIPLVSERGAVFKRSKITRDHCLTRLIFNPQAMDLAPVSVMPFH